MNTTANFFRKGEKRMGITAYLPVYWLIALVVFLVIEAATLGLATIWFAGGALVALIAAMCGAGIVIQIVLFLVVSLVLLFFTRPLAVRFLNKDTLKTNVDRVVGMEGVVTEEISNLAGTGKVSLGGNVWTARTENEGGTIPVDAVVTVLRVEGVKLIVKVKEKKEEMKHEWWRSCRNFIDCASCDCTVYRSIVCEDRAAGQCLRC